MLERMGRDMRCEALGRTGRVKLKRGGGSSGYGPMGGKYSPLVEEDDDDDEKSSSS